jgi:hypothetical protein
MKYIILLGAFLTGTAVQASEFSSCKSGYEPIKDKIIQVSKENMTDTSKMKDVRAQLENLTSKLIRLCGRVTENQILALSPGGWQQIWSDEKNMDPIGAPQRDLAQIYQYVSTEGWGFNFAERVLANGQKIVFALEVVASVEGNKQTTEITKAYLRMSAFNPAESLTEMSLAIRSNETDFQERDAGKFPNGPIGAKGDLSILFLDEDLKIGKTKNVYDGNVEMFVMQKTDKVIN